MRDVTSWRNLMFSMSMAWGWCSVRAFLLGHHPFWKMQDSRWVVSRQVGINRISTNIAFYTFFNLVIQSDAKFERCSRFLSHVADVQWIFRPQAPKTAARIGTSHEKATNLTDRIATRVRVINDRVTFKVISKGERKKRKICSCRRRNARFLPFEATT